jgi:hypothetical protein
MVSFIEATLCGGKMNKRSLLVLAVVVCVGAGVVEVSRRGLQSGADPRQADAAFRDGSFQAKIDIENNRRPHFSTSRWSTDSDRASFIVGYEQTYRELAEARSGNLVEPTAAELAGFRDGMLDGAHDRTVAQPFQLSKTENYRNAARGFAEMNTDPEVYRQHYRGAYSNGYQEGYYSTQESAELGTVSRKGPF